MSDNAANDLLMSGGIKAASFDTMGTTVIGTITADPKVAQMHKFDDKGKITDELAFWKSGDPMMQIVVTIQTDQRDDTEDDGRRQLYIPPRMQDAVRDAVKAVHAKGIGVGGRIAVQWYDGSGHGAGNPKQYRAQYQPPQVDPGLLNTPAAPAPAAAAAPPDPWANTAPAQQAAQLPNISATVTVPPVTGGLFNATPQSTVAPPPGIDPAAWANYPDEQKRAILAAFGPAPF